MFWKPSYYHALRKRREKQIKWQCFETIASLATTTDEGKEESWPGWLESASCPWQAGASPASSWPSSSQPAAPYTWPTRRKYQLLETSSLPPRSALCCSEALLPSPHALQVFWKLHRSRAPRALGVSCFLRHGWNDPSQINSHSHLSSVENLHSCISCISGLCPSYNTMSHQYPSCRKSNLLWLPIKHTVKIRMRGTKNRIAGSDISISGHMSDMWQVTEWRASILLSEISWNNLLFAYRDSKLYFELLLRTSLL